MQRITHGGGAAPPKSKMTLTPVAKPLVALKAPVPKGRPIRQAPKPPETPRQALARVPARQITTKQGEPPAPAATSSGRRAQNTTALKTLARAKIAQQDRNDPVTRKLVKAGYITETPYDPAGLFSKTIHHHLGVGPLSITPFQRQMAEAETKSEGLTPVAVQALNYVARPAHAIFGGVDAAVKGGSMKDIYTAVHAGQTGKGQVLAGQVLKDAGVHSKLIQGVAGGAADIVLDPTTYVSLGAGSVAERAAEQAAKDGYKQAIRGGMSEDGAQLVARRSAQAAVAKAAPGRGLTVSFAGHEIPGIRAASGAAGRVAKKLVPSAAKTVGGGVKDVARDLRPQLTPSGVDAGEHVAARAMARRSRATITNTTARVEQQARALAKRVPAADQPAVVDAIETGDFSKLSPELAKSAHFLRSQFKGMKRLRTNAGIAEGELPNYFPHARQDILDQGYGVHAEQPEGAVLHKGTGGRTVQPGSAKTRLDRRPLSDINPEREAKGLPKFSTNAPLVYGNYGVQTGKAVAKGHLLKELATLGRDVKPGTVVGDGEQVYHFGVQSGRLGLREVKDSEIGKQPGRYVVLNKKLVDKTVEAGAPAQAASATGRAIDKTTGIFKRVATGSIAFHARNAIGDTQMAYLAQSGRRLPVNAAQAGKALKRLSAVDSATRHLEEAPATDQTIKIAGVRTPIDDLLKGARDNGVIRSGFVGRELQDLAGRAAKEGLTGRDTEGLARRRFIPARPVVRAGRAGRKALGGSLQRAMQNREDLMRLATYKSGLDRGLSPEKAADLSLGTHIDYGDLTDVERKYMRRIAPFYTFTARGLPIHTKALLTNPGKFATIEKIIEEVAHSTGANKTKAYAQLQQYEQQQAPLIVGNKQASASLPLTLLNDLPDPKHPGASFSSLFDQGASLLNPLVEIPLEVGMNRSFFTHQPIQDPAKGTLVAAPAWAAHLPAAAKKALGVTTKLLDKQSGKKVLGWSAYAGYAASQVPGLIGQANAISATGTSQRGQSRGQKLATDLTGVRVSPVDAPSVQQLNKLFSTYDKVQQQMATLRQEGASASTPTPAYTRLLAKNKALTKQIESTSAAGGSKHPIFSRPAAKSNGLTAAENAALGNGGGIQLTDAEKAALGEGGGLKLTAAEKAALGG